MSSAKMNTTLGLGLVGACDWERHVGELIKFPSTNARTKDHEASFVLHMDLNFLKKQNGNSGESHYENGGNSGYENGGNSGESHYV